MFATSAVPLAAQVFHFTDTARLPWIIRSGELQPGRNKIGDFPGPDLVWATTDPRGDVTASADRGEPYRTGKVRHVRFTLDIADFIPWAQVPEVLPQWTQYQVRRLEAFAEGRSAPSNWWCRVEPLPLTACLKIETRSYADNRWLPWSDSTDAVFPVEPDWLAVSVGRSVYASRQVAGPSCSVGYEISPRMNL